MIFFFPNQSGLVTILALMWSCPSPKKDLSPCTTIEISTSMNHYSTKMTINPSSLYFPMYLSPPRATDYAESLVQLVSGVSPLSQQW